MIPGDNRRGMPEIPAISALWRANPGWRRGVAGDTDAVEGLSAALCLFQDTHTENGSVRHLSVGFKQQVHHLANHKTSGRGMKKGVANV